MLSMKWKHDLFGWWWIGMRLE